MSHLTLCFKTAARGCIGRPVTHYYSHQNKRPQHQKSGHHKSSVQRGENSEQDLPQSQSHHLKPSTANICAPIPNVHIANHQQVTHQHLYDHIHIHREGMRLFAKSIKASTLNTQKTHPDREERDSYAVVVSRRGRSDSTDLVQIQK